MLISRLPRSVRIAAGIVVGIAVVLLLLGALFPWPLLTGPLAHLATRALHRHVELTRFDAHPLRWAPSVELQGLSIADADWAGSGDLVHVDRLTLALEPWRLLTGRLVLSHLEIDNPVVTLRREADGRANWDFSGNSEAAPQPQPADAPLRLPAVHAFTLRGGQLQVQDALRRLRFDGKVGATENAGGPAREPFTVNGHGELNGKAFDLQFHGSALFNLQLDAPYRFQSSVHAGALAAQIEGSIDHPFDLGHFDALLKITGQNLAGVYYLTGLALPNTPPFELAGQLRRDGQRFTLRKIAGRLGHSDLGGDVVVDMAGTRPRFTADLVSQSLDLGDLAPAVGAGVDESAQSDLSAPNASDHGRLLPTHRFDFSRLSTMDASVELRAASVQTQKVPIKSVDFKVTLERGVLQLQPLDFTLPEGQISGAIKIDSRDATPQAAIDMRLRNVHLAQFKPATAEQAPLDGVLESRAQLEGSGASVHDIFADASGTLIAVIPHGEVRQALAEFAGINVVRGLGLLVTDKDKTTTIRCGIAAFRIDHGKAQTEQVVFDTDPVLITGSGGFDVDAETLDLKFQGHPKKFSPLRLHTPIDVRGTFTHPTFSLDPKNLLAQGGVAAALGAIAAPVAAAVAFIDPGLAKNQDCAALLATPKARAAEQPGRPQTALPAGDAH